MSSVGLHDTGSLSVADDVRFYDCLKARERGLALILIGHFASDHHAMLQLAEQIGRHDASLDVWASATETDRVQRV